MIEPMIEDRAEAERIKKEYLRIQERLAIRGLISAKRAPLSLKKVVYCKNGSPIRLRQ